MYDLLTLFGLALIAVGALVSFLDRPTPRGGVRLGVAVLHLGEALA